MSDSCLHCTVRGNLMACRVTRCNTHTSWYANQHGTIQKWVAENELLRLDVERLLGDLRWGRDQCEERDAEIERLKNEIRVLRLYGNKDCTAMADDALAGKEKNDGV